eukprot:4206016-Alexandrium_andersonii.AAC.1
MLIWQRAAALHILPHGFQLSETAGGSIRLNQAVQAVMLQVVLTLLIHHVLRAGGKTDRGIVLGIAAIVGVDIGVVRNDVSAYVIGIARVDECAYVIAIA